jgi:hypothetical protein
LLDSATFTFARAVTYETMNLYAVKMAGVFMISTSTLTIRTGITPRWIAFLGFVCALLLLFRTAWRGTKPRLPTIAWPTMRNAVSSAFAR